MGIPHLAARLQTYATPRHISRDKDDATSIHPKAIIDGPSFAYHIYNLCLGRKSSAVNVLEAVPSYLELGITAIAWLQRLELCGLNMYE